MDIRKLVTCATASGGRDNIKIIRPAKALGKHIIDHRISPESFRTIYENCKDDKPHYSVVTRYYSSDILLTIRDDIYENSPTRRATSCSINYIVECIDFPELSMQLTREQYFNLSVTRFPKMLNYDHERQSIEISYTYSSGVTLILEILIAGIRIVEDINYMDVIEEVLAGNTTSIISLSYRLMLDDSASERHVDNVLRFKITK